MTPLTGSRAETGSQIVTISFMLEVMHYCGFWRRVAAYLIDALPITLIAFVLIAPNIGYYDALRTHMADRRDPQARAVLVEKRRIVRNSAALLLVVYGMLLEASPMRGTVGKRMLRMQVVDANGNRLKWWQAMLRNVVKLLSTIPIIGLVWVAFDRKKRGWHDFAGGSLVVARPRRVRDSEGSPDAPNHFMDKTFQMPR